MVKLVCLKCQTEYGVDESYSGRKVRCQCGQRMTVPLSDSGESSVIRFVCPYCNTAEDIAPDMIGKKFQCSICEKFAIVAKRQRPAPLSAKVEPSALSPASVALAGKPVPVEADEEIVEATVPAVDDKLLHREMRSIHRLLFWTVGLALIAGLVWWWSGIVKKSNEDLDRYQENIARLAGSPARAETESARDEAEKKAREKKDELQKKAREKEDDLRKAREDIERKVGSDQYSVMLCLKLCRENFHKEDPQRLNLTDVVKVNSGNMYSVQARVTKNGKKTPNHCHATFIRKGLGDWETVDVTWIEIPF